MDGRVFSPIDLMNAERKKPIRMLRAKNRKNNKTDSGLRQKKLNDIVHSVAIALAHFLSGLSINTACKKSPSMKKLEKTESPYIRMETNPPPRE
jgi:hypothetical protein